MDNATIEALGSSQLCKGLSEDGCRKLASIAVERKFKEREVLFSLGETADSLFVLSAGSVELTFPLVVLGETKSVRAQTVSPGGLLAWSALVAPHRLTMGARAVAPSTVCALPRASLEELFDDQPRIGWIAMANLARVIGTRLHEAQALFLREVQRNVTAAR